MIRLIKSNFGRHFLLFLTNILNISSPQERVTLEKTAKFIVTNINMLSNFLTTNDGHKNK